MIKRTWLPLLCAVSSWQMAYAEYGITCTQPSIPLVVIGAPEPFSFTCTNNSAATFNGFTLEFKELDTLPAATVTYSISWSAGSNNTHILPGAVGTVTGTMLFPSAGAYSLKVIASYGGEEFCNLFDPLLIIPIFAANQIAVGASSGEYSQPLIYTGALQNWTLRTSPHLPLPEGATISDLGGANCLIQSGQHICNTVGYAYLTQTSTNIPLAYYSTDGGVSWSLYPSFNLPTINEQPMNNGSLKDVSCVGSNCATVGDTYFYDGEGGTPQYPLIYYSTTNPSTSWNNVSNSMLTLPNYSGYQTDAGLLRAITCLGNNCLATGTAYTTIGFPYYFGLTYSSADNGATWTLNTNLPDNIPYSLTGMELYGAGHSASSSCSLNGRAFAVGEAYSNNTMALNLPDSSPVVYYTDDWGGSWTIATGGILPVPGTSNQGTLYGIDCNNASTCITVGSASTSGGSPLVPIVYRSLDCGSSWAGSVIAVPTGYTEAQLNHIHYDSATNSWTAVASSNGTNPSTGIIYTSTDDGLTWNLVYNGNGLDLPPGDQSSALQGNS